jgi:hypothetical protein
MRKLAVCCGIVLGLFLNVPAAPAQDPPPKKKKDDSHSREATEQDYKALGHTKEVVGRLLSLDVNPDAKEGLGQKMTLKVEYPTLELKPGKAGQMAVQRQLQNLQRQQQQAQRDYQRILRIRNPYQQQQQLAQLLNRLQVQQQQQANAAANPANSPYRTVTTSVTFELPIQQKVKVARVKLPVEYDDKGNVVEYTKEDLKKKKDPSMPGYTAKMEDVEPGQLLRVYLARPKPAAKKKDDPKADAADKEKAADAGKAELKAEVAKDKAAAKDVAKDKEKAKDETPPEAYRPEVRMILILTDADPNSIPRETQNKTKKKKDQ